MTRNNSTSSQNEIIHLDFAHPHLSQSPEQRTLQSLVKVQGTLGLYQDGLYLLTHHGDGDALFQRENQLAMDNPMIEQAWRYQSMSETLERAEGIVDWQAGMTILRDAAQKGTTWSAVYAPLTKELHVSVYQQWGTIYHLELS